MSGDNIKPSQACLLALVKAFAASLAQVCCDWQNPTEHTVNWEVFIMAMFQRTPFLLFVIFFLLRKVQGICLFVYWFFI